MTPEDAATTLANLREGSLDATDALDAFQTVVAQGQRIEDLAEETRRLRELLDARNETFRIPLAQAKTRIHELTEQVAALTADCARFQRVCDEALPREYIACPDCGTPHIEGARFDNPQIDGSRRPHHTHRCYHCEHVWDEGRWSFGADVPKPAPVPLIHRITFDPEVDVARLYLREIGRGDARLTVSVGHYIALDFGADGGLLGVEVQNARAMLPPEILARAVPPGRFAEVVDLPPSDGQE